MVKANLYSVKAVCDTFYSTEYEFRNRVNIISNLAVHFSNKTSYREKSYCRLLLDSYIRSCVMSSEEAVLSVMSSCVQWRLAMQNWRIWCRTRRRWNVTGIVNEAIIITHDRSRTLVRSYVVSRYWCLWNCPSLTVTCRLCMCTVMDLKCCSVLSTLIWPSSNHNKWEQYCRLLWHMYCLLWFSRCARHWQHDISLVIWNCLGHSQFSG